MGECMTTNAARHVEIDNIHSAAICREIGHRLERYFANDTPPDASPELERLLERLRQRDGEQH
jgi:hypothetical protein